MPLGAAEAALGSSLPPQAVSDSDNQAASGNAADDSGRTCMDFSLNVFVCADGKARGRDLLRNARERRTGPGLSANEYRKAA
ncbi:hypothetical protein MAFF301069_01230 [Ralstonia pseudosolanacearum]|nr:hypothetical protein MAFF301069_01230 [Ralstonia pseudosolanacearum]